MKYSFWQNFFYIIHNWFRWDRSGTIMLFTRVPVAVLLPIVTALIPRWMVDSLSSGIGTVEFAAQLSLLFACIFALSILQEFLNARLESFQAGISMHYAAEMMDKLLHMSYQVLESYEGRAKYQRCKNFAFEGTQTDGAWAAVRLTGLITSIAGIVTYSALFSRVNVWLLVVILLTYGIEYYASIKLIAYGNETENSMVAGEMAFYYFYRIASDPASSKDIRLSGAVRWLVQHLDRAAREYMRVLHRYTRKATELSGIQVLCTILRDMVTFFFLIHSVLTGGLPVADFLFFFTLTTGFSDWLGGISGHISSLKRITRECDHYRAFLELPETEAPCDAVDIQSIDWIEFRNVTFAYPSGETVLQDISFSAMAGERIALIGENGAGKTTLIKLLCGLYTPTAGEILVNGIDIKRLDLKRYYRLISALFQEYMVLPVSMEDNILLGKQCPEGTVNELLAKVGLAEKYENASSVQALELSGGEKQRLLLARALYKDAPLLVLDEPTAAMDPLAEQQLYQQYSEISEGKISIFISHRLASTRFCDRILLLSRGRIAEDGSHDELMARDGLYKQMYDMQAYYYQGGEDV